MAFKMTEQVEQWIYIKFCLKLEHFSMETIQVSQKSAAIGNWWLAASSWQCTCSHITSCAKFFGKISSHPGDSDPLKPRFGTLWFLAFPKITFEREEISDHHWDSGKYGGTTDGNWKNCVRSQGAYFEGDWGITVLCTMFLVSCIFFNKCLFFTGHGILSGQTMYGCMCVCVCVCIYICRYIYIYIYIISNKHFLIN